jgi:rsbT co-antagonist protein RsbR
MIEAARQFLDDFLREHREEVIDAATDWVVAQAKDLRGQRPRQETRRLVAGVVAWNEALILRRDSAPLTAFIEHVTTMRASSEFHISTLLRGFGSFRAAMADLVAPPRVDGSLAFFCLRLVDEAYTAAIFAMGDEYVGKLNSTIVERRRQLEVELAEVAEQRRREHERAMAVIHEQAELLRKVSLPILKVWQGVLVLPLIGDLSAERAAALTERLLDAIVLHRARFIILDITGMSSVDEAAAAGLWKALRATRLLGATGMLVGVSPDTAAALSRSSPGPVDAPTFCSLGDGLLVALKQQGLQVLRPASAPRREKLFG